jgi:hypothetical protein
VAEALEQGVAAADVNVHVQAIANTIDWRRLVHEIVDDARRDIAKDLAKAKAEVHVRVRVDK